MTEVLTQFGPGTSVFENWKHFAEIRQIKGFLTILIFPGYDVMAVSSAMTSTLVVNANKVPHYIKGITEAEGLVGGVNEGARSRRWNGHNIINGEN